MAAAVTKAVDDTVQAGGKRKSKSNETHEMTVKRVKCEESTAEKYFKHQLTDNEHDGALDSAEELRMEIRALKSRPVFESRNVFISTVQNFLETLAFQSKLPADTDEYYAEMLYNLFQGPTTFEKVHELSLLLRLFVALGGNLNIVLYPTTGSIGALVLTEMQRAQRAAADKNVCPVRTTLAAVLISRIPMFVVVVLVCGRRLRIQWDAVSVMFRRGWNCDTMFQNAHLTLATKNPLKQRGELVGVKRLFHVAGELGVLYSIQDPVQDPDEQPREQLQMVFGQKLAFPLNIEPVHCSLHLTPDILEMFQNDEASPYEFSEVPNILDEQEDTRIVIKNINARRRAYRSSIHLHVGAYIQPPVLYSLIVSYLMAPQATIPPSPFF